MYILFLLDLKIGKKSIEKCNNLNKSRSHIDNIECILSLESSRTILSHINEHFTADQIIWRGIFKKTITTIKYLSSEGMALRGQHYDDGHFLNLLKLRTEYDRLIYLLIF